MVSAERQEVVPVGVELRTLAWLGVMIIATGVDIFIGKHLDEIGPLAIAVALGALAAACYVWVALKSLAIAAAAALLPGSLVMIGCIALAEYLIRAFASGGPAWSPRCGSVGLTRSSFLCRAAESLRRTGPCRSGGNRSPVRWKRSQVFTDRHAGNIL